MSQLDDDNSIDIFGILAKTLYLGLFTNVLLPAGLLMICYYYDQNSYVSDKVGDMGDVVFFVLAALASGQAAYAFWRRGIVLREPMIRSEETFAQDLADGLLGALRPVFLIVAGISLYGYLYFFLTGRFMETVIVVLISFIGFQVIRPRQGAIRKLIEHQMSLVKNDVFLNKYR